MSLDVNKVPTKFQHDWPANNRIIAGSLFSDSVSKCWQIQQWLPRQPSFYIYKMSLDLNNVSTKFQHDWPANNRSIAGSLFSHFSGTLFSDFSKCLGNTGMVAKATKFLYLKDES